MKQLLLPFLLLVTSHTWAQPATSPGVLMPKCRETTYRNPSFPVDRVRSGRVLALLRRPSLSGDTILVTVELLNRSSLRYDIDFIRFVVRDRRPLRRATAQEEELTPLALSRPASGLEDGRGGKTIGVALPRFALTKGKSLFVEVFERTGGRHLILRLGRRTLEAADPIICNPNFSTLMP